ncbi:MAG: hypothetical protein NZO16_04170 [Deltaproteobacteria bacterium]|nr:hypothetical protein [Deltaproteobacteria bacterium]
MKELLNKDIQQFIDLCNSTSSQIDHLVHCSHRLRGGLNFLGLNDANSHLLKLERTLKETIHSIEQVANELKLLQKKYDP